MVLIVATAIAANGELGPSRIKNKQVPKMYYIVFN